MDLHIAKLLVQDAMNKADRPPKSPGARSLLNSVLAALRNAVQLVEMSRLLIEERKALEVERRQIETLRRLALHLVSENKALKEKLAARPTR